MRRAPGVEDGRDAGGKDFELAVAEDGGLHVVRLRSSLAIPLTTVACEQSLPQRWEELPVRIQGVNVPVRDTAVQVRVKVVQVFGLAGIDIAGDVEVVVVSGARDFGHRHHA